MKMDYDDNRDDFNFSIVNFPLICCSIQAAYVYARVYISQLLRHSMACSSYLRYLVSWFQLMSILLTQGTMTNRSILHLGSATVAIMNLFIVIVTQCLTPSLLSRLRHFLCFDGWSLLSRDCLSFWNTWDLPLFVLLISLFVWGWHNAVTAP